MMATSENNLRKMIASFKEDELKLLLETFGYNNNFSKRKLIDKALELLRTKPPAINFSSYVSKIVDIYHSAEKKNGQKKQMLSLGFSTQQVQLFPNRPPANSIIPKNVDNLHNIRVIYHHNVPHQPHQQLFMVPVQLARNPTYSIETKNDITHSDPPVHNFIFKKLPFYEIIDAVLKPNILIGQEMCTLPYCPIGTREFVIKFKMSAQRSSEIALNRHLCCENNIYHPQMIIRLGVLGADSTEIIDCMPLGLYVRVSDQVCPLPPLSPPPQKSEARRILPLPINCTELLKVNPSFFNQININWYPDGKTYIIGVYCVNRLSSDTLVEKLKHKKAKRSEETKNDIIKKSTVHNSDLVTTCYRFSLMCPLSKLKMKLPAKSIDCKHLQCFDAIMFIKMNEKRPTWICPICGKSCLFNDLQIQSYFLEIVNNSNLPEWCNEIELLADGTWKVYKEKPLTNRKAPKCGVHLGHSSVIVSEKSRPSRSEMLKSDVVDLTLSDNEEPPNKKKNKAIDSA